jgi:biofilm PGA synthesis N-glycosyltransferase PgaC
MPRPDSTYVVISPVRDEEKYVEATLRSLTNQTVKPLLWVVVDDGSHDRTAKIVSEYALKHDWIWLHKVRPQGTRNPGSGVVHAFNAGSELVRNLEYDFIVKLDCDLNLPPNYFEQLLLRFDQDQTLGIASGVYLERRGQRWIPVRMPAYHAAGASKMIRGKCFKEIGGFVTARGWDTVDEIRAWGHGWKSTHFTDLEFQHLKPEGSGIGYLRTGFMLGEIYYLTGGGGWFFLLKIVHRVFAVRPILLEASAMLLGFLKCLISRPVRLVTAAEARNYKSVLNRRITDALSNWFRWTGLTTEPRSNS